MSDGRGGVSTKSKRACQVCGTALGDDSDSCPVCALRGVLGSESAITRGSPENAFFKNRRNLLGTNFACSCRPQDIVGAGVNFRAVENLKLLNLPKNA